MRTLALGVVAACGRLDFSPIGTVGDGGGGPCRVSPLLQGQRTTTIGTSPLDLAVGDLDHDGHADIVVVNEGDNTVTVLAGDGTGAFTPTQTFAVGTDPKFPLLADVDGDGNLDLVVANGGDATIWIVPGSGTTTFGAAHTTAAVGNGPRWIALGALVPGGLPDLVVENNGSSDLTVLPGTMPRGTFGPSSTITLGAAVGPHGMVLADLDGDGMLDVATSNIDDKDVAVLYGNGDRTFAAPQVLPGTNYPGSLSAADLNGDGRLDLVVPNTNDGTVGVFLNTGGRTFAPQVTYPELGGPNTAFAADVDGDGQIDVVTSNGGDSSSNGTDTIALLLGNGDGTLQSPIAFASGTKPWGIVAADLDGDGRTDVAIVNEGVIAPPAIGSLGVYLNGCR